MVETLTFLFLRVKMKKMFEIILIFMHYGEKYMIFQVCLAIAALLFFVALIGAVVLALSPYRQKRFFKSFFLLTCGVFLSATIFFYPLYCHSAGTKSNWLLSLLMSVHNAIRIFVVDCDFSFVIEQTSHLSDFLQSAYVSLSAILFVLAPILTAGAVLSFFENLSAHRRFLMGFFKDTYIFSELNKRSLTLARDLKKNDPKRMIVFTDVFKKDEEEYYELAERAKELGAILFKNDITVVNFRLHSKKSKLYFFILGENEEENINQTICLAAAPSRKHGASSADSTDSVSNRFSKRAFSGYDYPREDTRLFLFSTNASSEQQLSALNTAFLKLRRVNDVQSMIYKHLYDDGMQIFDSAQPTGRTIFNSATGQNDAEKQISALVIGLGLQGTEMVKSLSWFCQMHPYRLKINAFDLKKDAAAKFQSLCPDLFDGNPADHDCSRRDSAQPLHNGDFETPGEAHYEIAIHSGYNVENIDFDEKIKKLTDTTYVLVALGNDDLNIRTAVKLRILLKRVGAEPVIHAIVYNPDKHNLIENGQNYANQSYRICPIGDLSANYSEHCLLHSELEKEALDRHLSWVIKNAAAKNLSQEEFTAAKNAEEEMFWKHDYNYRSSMASAIHMKYKKLCGIPGSHKKPDERTEEEKVFFRTLEHQRWNAYVRSEGFVYNKVRDKLAKTHHLLVPFDELPLEEQLKDDD